jgi:hypothetical protein
MDKKDYSILEKAFGCDFVVKLPQKRSTGQVRILQITDPQMIDMSQIDDGPSATNNDDVWESRKKAWAPENFDRQCGNHIRSLIAQTDPDFIFITGDVVYGRYDNNGSALKWLSDLMDSFCIPWSPVFGNHDNEAKVGVDYQCGIFEESEYCLFNRGEVTGNGNYTVGIAVGDELVRVVHLLDSNGCTHSDDPSVMKKKGIYPDQFELVEKNTLAIRRECGKNVPAFLGFHIPHSIFHEAEVEKGYFTSERNYYVIGVDVEAKDGDFGFKLDACDTFGTDVDIAEFSKQNDIEGIFIGHHHNTATVINYKGIKLVFGLKTGQYDSYIPGNIGGTLITLWGKEYTVNNISSCCPYGPVPVGELRYKGFFQE